MAEELQVPTAERTLKLIELLLDQPEGLTPQDMLIHLDLSRSALFMLLRTLKTLGYIEQAEKRGRYRIGPRLEAWRTVSQGPSANDLLKAFYQETSRDSWSETLGLLVPSHQGLLLLAQIEGNQQIRSVLVSGQVYSGLSAPNAIFAQQTPKNVKSNGYAINRDNESVSLALPVCRDGRFPNAALLLSAPAFRWQEDDKLLDAFLNDLREMAARLSYQMGALAYTPYQNDETQALQNTSELREIDIRQFLQGPLAARLACVRPEGHPHVIPVWQEWDGDHFYVIAWQDSQWATYLLNNPNVSLSVDEPWPPYRRVVVRGQANAVDVRGEDFDINGLLSRMSRRYLGQEDLSLGGKIEWAFRIEPEYLRGWQGVLR